MSRVSVDENQPDIVRALEAVGATVVPLCEVGNGVPDLLVGFLKRTYLLEVKNPENDTRTGQLLDSQVKWHARWRGHPVAVVRSPLEALAAIGVRGNGS